MNPKLGRNRLHLELAVPIGLEPAAEADRLVDLGATRAGPSPCDRAWIELFDPDGNEFCLEAPTRS